MKRTATALGGGNRAIPVLAVLVLIMVVAAIAAFVAVSRFAQHGEQYQLRVAEQQVLSQKVAKHAFEALGGDKTAFDRLRMDRDRFTTLLEQLKLGDPEAGLPASPPAVAEPCAPSTTSGSGCVPTSTKSC
jgi:twitching motility protein PilJ